MSTTTDLLGAEAAPLEFHHDGETFAVSPVTQERKTAISRYLRGLAYADLYEQRATMPGDQYAESLEALQRDRAGYQYLGPVFWSTLATPEGSVMMVRVLFGVDESKARKLLRDRRQDVEAVVQEQILASMPREQSDVVRGRMEAAKKKAEQDKAGNPLAPA